MKAKHPQHDTPKQPPRDSDPASDARAAKTPKDVQRVYSMSVDAVMRSQRTLERSQELLKRMGVEVEIDDEAANASEGSGRGLE